jgi:truncated hemoglobin YjbI
MRLSIKVVY